jgi:hypothetical protein
MKSESRTPKPERNPKARSPKEGWGEFGIRFSELFRIAGIRTSALVVSVLLFASASLIAATNSTPTRAIGIEGRVTLDLPRGDYRPRPLDDRTELILRIESVTPAPNQQHRYDFHYMGLEPGSYSLANYLIRPDGSRPDELSNTLVQVKALLPENHDGKLTSYTPERFPFIGGYRVFLGLVALLWAGGIAGFVISYRKKRVITAPPAVVPEPSFAERIRPLVEAAANGTLTPEGKAQLERLMMGFWREKLNLPAEQRMAEALERLKAHAQAGELLRALERWLHQRASAPAEEVRALLAPYRNGGAA